MRGIIQVFTKGLFILMFSSFVISCASIPELKVHYQLPPTSDKLKGQKVMLVFEDARKTKEILGQGAKQEFRNFSGNISFSIARDKDPGFKIGVFPFSSIMKEAFRKRLENEGLELLLEQSSGEPQLVITLNEFILDLVKSKWVVEMSYEARLAKNGEVLSRQTIKGNAERYKLVGRGAADTVTGEIFSDLVNRLDVLRLFQQAKLVAP